jgi:hypothetical protein
MPARRRSEPVTLSRLARGALALLALGLLSACMTSKRPLFDAATGVAALGDGGTYGSFERQEDGSFKRDATIKVTREGTTYAFINSDQDAKPTPITFHPLREKIFVGQATTPKGGYAYLVFRFDGADIFIHVPDCEKQDKARVAALGARIERLECKLDGVGDAKAFFDMLDIGQPHAKMVRE